MLANGLARVFGKAREVLAGVSEKVFGVCGCKRLQRVVRIKKWRDCGGTLGEVFRFDALWTSDLFGVLPIDVADVVRCICRYQRGESLQSRREGPLCLQPSVRMLILW